MIFSYSLGGSLQKCPKESLELTWLCKAYDVAVQYCTVVLDSDAGKDNVKGPHAASARELLKAFRLVPEDVKVPLEALTWVYEASTSAEASDSGAPSLLHLRRCTKMLIDRCLVLVSNVTLSNVTRETE